MLWMVGDAETAADVHKFEFDPQRLLELKRQIKQHPRIQRVGIELLTPKNIWGRAELTPLVI
jgi:hypothetical protein